jgi:hypothetical protein
MITLLNKTYDGESIVDCHRDFSEAFDERFTPVNSQIPQDGHGFAEGEYRVCVTWEKDSQTVPDFTQLAKLSSMRAVPVGSDKVAFILSRLSFMIGAMARYAIQYPEMLAHPEFRTHVANGAHLMGQLDGGPIEASQVKFQGMLDEH